MVAVVKIIVSSYKNTYNEKSTEQIVPVVIIVFLGVLYLMSAQGYNNHVSFMLIGVAAIVMIFWARVLKNMIKSNAPKYSQREQETKNWVYDLIKGDREIVFVAEVPGPEDKIMVRLISGILYIRGSGGFNREVPISGSEAMQISDFKYRNGVLTLKIG